MNEEIKTQWVQALRSGDYEQGKGVLQGDGKFCCLGVLCDLAEKAGVIEGENAQHSRTDYEIVRGYSDGYAHSFTQTEILPMRVRDWAETDSSPTVTTDGGYRHSSLAELNDEGSTFDEIADLIEIHL